MYRLRLPNSIFKRKYVKQNPAVCPQYGEVTLGGERFKVQAEGDGRHRVTRDTKFGETNIPYTHRDSFTI